MRRLRGEAQRERLRLTILCVGVTAVLAASLLASLLRYTGLSGILLYVGPLPIVAYLLADEFFERRRRRIQRRLIEDLERTIERVSR